MITIEIIPNDFKNLSILSKWSFFVVVFLLSIAACNTKKDPNVVHSNEKIVNTETDDDTSKPDVLQIYLAEFDLYFLPDSCPGTTRINLLGNKGVIEATISDCKGKMLVKQYNNNEQLILTGSYINSIDTLVKYSIGRSVIIDSKRVNLLKYFQPLPDGKWTYFSKGKEVSYEIYKEGIKQVE